MIRDFKYLRPTTVKEALEILSQYAEEAKIIAGGQSLLILMRQGLVAPPYLIDIKHLNEINYIEAEASGGIRIGATTTHRAIEKSALIKERFPLLSQMEEKLASIQTRNWGTIGGNLCHADPAGDPAPVLIALNASFKVASSRGEREVAAEEFFLDYFETALEEGEMLLEIKVPPMAPKTAVSYQKFTIIDSDMGIVAVAASITLDGGKKCKEARLVLGGAAPIPMRAKGAEELLQGGELDDALLEEVGRKASEEAEPISDIHASEAYKRELVKVLAKRMVKRAWEEAMRG